jgi:hypothetical protein
MIKPTFNLSGNNIKSYLGLSYLISWSIINRNILIALFSMQDLNYVCRINLLNSSFPKEWYCYIWCFVGYPLLVSFGVTVLFLILKSVIKALTEYGNDALKNKILSIFKFPAMVSRNDYLLANGKAKEFHNETIQYRKELQDEKIKQKELSTSFLEAKEAWETKKVGLEKDNEDLIEQLQSASPSEVAKLKNNNISLENLLDDLKLEMQEKSRALNSYEKLDKFFRGTWVYSQDIGDSSIDRLPIKNQENLDKVSFVMRASGSKIDIGPETFIISILEVSNKDRKIKALIYSSQDGYYSELDISLHSNQNWYGDIRSISNSNNIKNIRLKSIV